MMLDGLGASTVAFEVIFESVSHFNREYSRYSGQPPMRDIKALRERKLAENERCLMENRQSLEGSSFLTVANEAIAQEREGNSLTYG